MFLGNHSRRTLNQTHILERICRLPPVKTSTLRLLEYERRPIVASRRIDRSGYIAPGHRLRSGEARFFNSHIVSCILIV